MEVIRYREAYVLSKGLIVVGLLSVYLSLSQICFADTSSPSEKTLRICSQNLFRYGEVTAKFSAANKTKQLNYIVTRIKRAECDVIALQEVVGDSLKAAKRTIAEISSSLQLRTGSKFQTYLGDSYDEHIRNGFLVRESRVKVLETKDYLQYPLPRVRPLGQGATFIRGPVAILVVPNDSRKKYWILNFHFKSRSFGHTDPSGTDFELLRMEMAEGVRQLSGEELKRLGSEVVPVLLGDRNSDLDSASAKILQGDLLLNDFSSKGSCKLDPDENVECSQVPRRDAKFIGLFAARKAQYPSEYKGGSYMYRKRQEILDEIYMLPEHLDLAKRNSGRFAIGFEGEFFKGSDHKLVWVELK